MKRDMDLVRLILLKIEEEYRSTAIYDLEINGYDMETIAYHCKIMYEAGLIADYDASYGGDELCDFVVSSLTWEGCDFIDRIRDNSFWYKTKEAVKEKGLPLIIETIKSISTAIISAAAEGVVTAILKQGGNN